MKLPEKRRRRRRTERITVAKAAKVEDCLLVQTAAKAETVKSAKAAQELKINATWSARQGFEGAARRN